MQKMVKRQTAKKQIVEAVEAAEAAEAVEVTEVVEAVEVVEVAKVTVVAIEGKREVLCPFCRSKRLIRRGNSRSKNIKKQKYACLNCNKFTVNPLLSISSK